MLYVLRLERPCLQRCAARESSNETATSLSRLSELDGQQLQMRLLTLQELCSSSPAKAKCTTEAGRLSKYLCILSIQYGSTFDF